MIAAIMMKCTMASIVACLSANLPTTYDYLFTGPCHENAAMLYMQRILSFSSHTFSLDVDVDASYQLSIIGELPILFIVLNCLVTVNKLST